MLFAEGVEKGYFVKRTNGDVWQWDMWQPGMALVDFTNPEACRWFQSKLEVLLDMGVDCFKTDFGERIPTEDIMYFDGSDPKKMHNYYTYLYNKCVYELLERKRGKGEAVLLPAPLPQADRSSLFIGAVTAGPTTSPWRRAFAAVFHCACPASASGAMI